MAKRFVNIIVSGVPMDEALELRKLIAKQFGWNTRISRCQTSRREAEIASHGKPRDAKLIKQIVRLRNKGFTWREIGPKLGMTHQGPYLLYRRWILGKHWREH